MFTQALNVDIATISKSAKGRVLFYDADGTCVLGLSELEQIQLQYDGGYIYVVQAGGGTGVFNQGNVPATPMAFNCSFYKFTVVGLTDIDGRPFTALEQPNYDQETYKAKVREAYEYLVANVFVGCCNTGTESILWYATEGDFPATGIVETIYVDMATPALFMWNGTAYVVFGGGSGGGVASVTGNIVDNTDPVNPVVTQVQADWTETDNTQPDYIANKPDLPTLYWPLAGNLGGPNYVTGSIEIDPSAGGFTLGQTSGGVASFLEIQSGNGIYTHATQGANIGVLQVTPSIGQLSVTDGTNTGALSLSSVAAEMIATNGTDNTQIYVTPTTAIVTSSYATFEGLKYNADYSANFILESLISQRVMKSRFWTKAGTPTTTDDSTQGYVVGSLIWDTTNDIFYKCTDNTASAAVWTTAISGGSTILKATTDSAAVTGTTTVTKLRSQLIPANTFAVGDIIRIRWRDRKTGTAGNATHSLYVNTSDTVTGASLLGFFTQTATRVSFQGKRDLVIKSSTVTEVADNGTSLVTDDADIQTAFDNINIDWTVDQYLIFAVNPANATDSMINSSYIIEPKQ